MVPQRDRPAAGRASPGAGEVLLGEFGCGIDIARVEGGILGDELGQQRAAVLVQRVEVAGIEVFDASSGWPGRMPRAVAVIALAVDDHGGGEDESLHSGVRHCGEQHRRAEIVASDVVGGILDRHAKSDLGGLVTDDIDAEESDGQGIRVPHIGPHELDARIGSVVVAVHIRPKGVEHANAPALLQARFDDRGTDESGTAGDQYRGHSVSLARTASTAAGSMLCRGLYSSGSARMMVSIAATMRGWASARRCSTR